MTLSLRVYACACVCLSSFFFFVPVSICPLCIFSSSLASLPLPHYSLFFILIFFSHALSRFCSQLETQKNALENELKSNLVLRQGELQQQLMDMSMENTGALDASRSALDRIRTEVEDINNRIEGVSVCLCVRVCSWGKGVSI